MKKNSLRRERIVAPQINFESRSVVRFVSQEEQCEHCQNNIIGGSSKSIHYMCEGSHCEQAQEQLREYFDEEGECVEFENPL